MHKDIAVEQLTMDGLRNVRATKTWKN